MRYKKVWRLTIDILNANEDEALKVMSSCVNSLDNTTLNTISDLREVGSSDRYVTVKRLEEYG